MKKILISLGFIGLVFTTSASAGCTCACVNGSVQAVCSSSLDIKPICSPRVCPIRTPSVRPIQTPTISPIGTTHCQKEEVYNDYKGRYEWKTVCR